MATSTFGPVVVTAPFTSPTVTLQKAVSDMSVDITLTVPTSGRLTFVAERFDVATQTWVVFHESTKDGQVPKPLVGTDQFHVLRMLPNFSAGDQIRMRAPVVIGSWTVTVSVTH